MNHPEKTITPQQPEVGEAPAFIRPQDIEAESMRRIRAELKNPLDPHLEPIILRVIHTTADFDYADNLVFSPQVQTQIEAALQRGARLVTDTTMALAGINKRLLSAHGGEGVCFIADPDVAAAAAAAGTTRSAAAVDKALAQGGEQIFVIGNAPTALFRLLQRVAAGAPAPAAVIGVPVGFVHVVEAKEALLASDLPFITARGRKGGSNVAAAICNALMYQLWGRKDG